MILDIFSFTTQQRIGMIKTFEFVQYEEVFCGVGTFTIKIPITEESLSLLQKNTLILFEEDVMGIVLYRSKTTEQTSSVEIKGYLLNKLLEYRSFLTTQSFTGTLTDIARAIVSSFFINNTDPRRNISLIELADEEEYTPESEESSIQDTGHSVEYVLESLLMTARYGFALAPVISNVGETPGTLTNLSGISFRVLKPADRTIGNTEGNVPVEFSARMGNLASSEYVEDYTAFCSVGIVAGEGEGSSRVTVEVGDMLASGIDRIELYVDARDLQSETEGGTLTDEEYRKVLRNRGYSYLEDHAAFTALDGTVIDGVASYQYGRDFFLGDLVSVYDEDLDLLMSVQITAVTKSLTTSGEKIDITFGKERATIQKIIRRRGII